MVAQKSPEGFLQACKRRAENELTADVEWITFADERGGVVEALSNADIWRQSGAIGAALLQKLKPGDRVLLVFTPGVEFVLTFLACMRAGLVGVPIAPPDFTQNGARAQEESRKFIRIVQASAAAAVLTDATYYQAKRLAGRICPGSSQIACVAVPDRCQRPTMS